MLRSDRPRTAPIPPHSQSEGPQVQRLSTGMSLRSRDSPTIRTTLSTPRNYKASCLADAITPPLFAESAAYILTRRTVPWVRFAQDEVLFEGRSNSARQLLVGLRHLRCTVGCKLLSNSSYVAVCISDDALTSALRTQLAMNTALST